MSEHLFAYLKQKAKNGKRIVGKALIRRARAVTAPELFVFVLLFKS